MYAHKLPVMFVINMLALSLPACNTFAQDMPAESISLKEALTIAAAGNNRILVSGAEEQLAHENVKEAREQKLPDFNLHTSYARRTNITEFVSGMFSGQEITYLHDNKYDVTVGGTMPVYRGGLLNNNIKKAGLAHEIAGLQHFKTVKDVNLEVTALYLGIYKLMQLDKLLAENVAEEKERLKEVQALKKHGTVTKNEVLRAQLQLNDRELLFLNNKKDIEIAYGELHTLLQYPENKSFIIDTVHILSLSQEADFAFLQNAALHNEEIKIAGQYSAMAAFDVKNARANYYPTVSLYGNYAYNYPNFMFFPAHWVPYTIGEIGIQVVYDIGSIYKNGAKVAIATKKEQIAMGNAKIMADTMHDLIFRQYTQYLELKDKYKVTEAASTLAAENYRIVRLQYLNRLVVITEMIDADNALLQAKYNHISARVDAVMKYYEMLHTAGISFVN